MIARQLISETITPLRSSETGAGALELMDEMRVSHLPIVEDEELIGLISDTDILTYNNLQKALQAILFPSPMRMSWRTSTFTMSSGLLMP